MDALHPTKIIGIGKNYAEHAREMGAEAPPEPIVFLIPPSAVIGDGDTIEIPRWAQRVDYEGELAIVIGQRAKDVSVDEADAYIAGYTVANDVSARHQQRDDGQWTRAKGFDTSTPILTPIIPADAINPQGLTIRTLINGEVVQEGNTADMLVDCRTLVSYLSQGMTLEPGDIILSGTPAGVGPIDDGDCVVVDISGIGKLSNFVKRLK